MSRRPRVDPAIIRALTDDGPALVTNAFDEAAAEPGFEDALFALGVAVGVARQINLVEIAFRWSESKDLAVRALLVPYCSGVWHAAGSSERQVRRLVKLVRGGTPTVDAELAVVLAQIRPDASASTRSFIDALSTG